MKRFHQVSTWSETQHTAKVIISFPHLIPSCQNPFPRCVRACVFPLPTPYLLRARVVPLGPRCSTTDPSIFELVFFHLNHEMGSVLCNNAPCMDRSNPTKQPAMTTVRHSCKPTTVIMKFNRVTWSMGPTLSRDLGGWMGNFWQTNQHFNLTQNGWKLEMLCLSHFDSFLLIWVSELFYSKSPTSTKIHELGAMRIRSNLSQKLGGKTLTKKGMDRTLAVLKNTHKCGHLSYSKDQFLNP